MMLNPKKRARHAKYLRERYNNDPEYRAKHKAIVAAANKRRREAVSDLIASFKSSGCSLCPETALCALTAHHLDPKKKDFGIGQATRYYRNIKVVEAELAKCVCLCMNCHAKLHAGLVGQAGLEPAMFRL